MAEGLLLLLFNALAGQCLKAKEVQESQQEFGDLAWYANVWFGQYLFRTL